MHLEGFLRTTAPDDPASAKFRAHAERTLAELSGTSPHADTSNGPDAAVDVDADTDHAGEG